MRAVAAVLGKEVLHGVTLDDLLVKADEIREKAGDRAYLRAIYFVTENIRVQNAVTALKVEDFDGFLKMVKASGDSSYIQAFVKNEAVNEYKNTLDKVFGEGTCAVLKVRKYGGMKVL